MKTALDQSTEIYKLLKASPNLSYAISGDIYKNLRPVDSKLEDVVVNTITLGEGSLQRGVSNVNIHVPDIQQGTVQKPFFVPNESRIQSLTELVKDILEDTFQDDYNLWIESTSLIRQPEINQHYMNFRVRFIFENP